MKIYTKKGDTGSTDLINKRVSKDDIRIEVNGTIDQCLAYISLAKQLIMNEEIIGILDVIYEHLSRISYEIVLDNGVSQMNENDIVYLENKIDFFASKLEAIKEFVKFDKSISASILNLTRVSVRDLERKMVELNKNQSSNNHSMQYVNRLSDLLFVLARKCNENIES